MSELGGRAIDVSDSAPEPDADGRAAWAAQVDPAIAIMTPMGVLDPAALSRRGRIDALVALERHKAWVEAEQQRVLAALASETSPDRVCGDRTPEAGAALDKQWVREEVACALRVSAPTAAARLQLAVDLTSRLPGTLALLHDGAISLPMARRLAESTAALDPRITAAVERRVLGRAAAQTFTQFAQAVRRAVLVEDPRGQEQQHAVALSERRVAVRPAEHGMAELWATASADAIAHAWAAVDRAARCGIDADERTIDQRRVDALINLLTGRPPCTTPAEPGDQPLPRDQRPAVQVTVALSTLLSLDEQPGELAGHGPIPASLARRIAADPSGTWRRLVTDEQGRLVDYGRCTYRPPAALADHVRARDRTCRFPTCNRRADRCELDHSLSWDDGGKTSATNLHPVCRRDHHVKHDAGWRTVRRDDDSVEWTAPTGHSYRKPAEILPIDTTHLHAGLGPD